MMPCARMHCENFSAFCRSVFCWPGGGGGRSDWHARCAAWNWGLSEPRSLPGPAWMPIRP